MTEQQAINKVIEIANSQVGYREGPNNYTKYAAELDPLKVFWGSKQNAAWCGTYVFWVFYKAFGAENALKVLCSPKPSGIPLCSSGAKYFKDAGRWSNKPQLGAVVFFYVSGGINHTGIVTGVSGLTVTTVEGNSSDMVSRRVYSANSSTIAGYGLPKWSEVADVSPSVSTNHEVIVSEPAKQKIDTSKTDKLPVLKKGDKGNAVKAAQILLRGWDCSVGAYGADGDFGNGTKSGVLAFQRRNGIEADGIIGAQTWAKLLGV